MSHDLSIEHLVPDAEGVPSHILHMCNLAYGEDLGPLWAEFGQTVHSVGKLNGELISHAMWVRHDLGQSITASWRPGEVW